MAFPTIGFGTVVGRFGVPLTPDTYRAAKGSVILRPDAERLIAAGPTTLLPATVVSKIDTEGYVVDDNGLQSLTLQATDGDTSPTGWTWTAEIRLIGQNPFVFSFSLPEGEVVDLTDVAPVSTFEGVPVVRGAQGEPGADGTDGTDGLMAPADTPTTVLGVSTTLSVTPAGLAIVAEKYDIRRAGAVGDNVADDGIAINTASNTVAAAGGGDLFYPSPSVAYKIITPIVPLTRVNHMGAGGRGGVPKCRVESTTSDIFQAPPAGTTVSSVRIEGLDLRSIASGGGHLFSMQDTNLSQWRIEWCTLRQDNDAKSIMSTAGGDALELHVSHCYHRLSTTATVPGWHMVSNDNSISICSWSKSRFVNSGDYCIHIETTGSDYCQDNEISNIDFQQCLGGEVRLLSVRDTSLRLLSGYDATTYTKDRYYVGKSATGSISVGNKFEHVVRRGGALAGGVYDIHTVSGESAGPHISMCNGQINCGSNNNTVVLGLSPGSPGGTLLNVTQIQASLNNGVITGRNFTVAGLAGAGYLELTTEQSADPAAPAANGCRLYTKDVAGKTTLFARFATGAVVNTGIVEP